MFTGIIQALGSIKTIVNQPTGKCLIVSCPHGGSDTLGNSDSPIAKGDSIAVNGVCLTVVDFDNQSLSFDVIAQTLNLTTLGCLAQGDSVNLETSVTASTPLGGHMVQGHVLGVGTVTQAQNADADVRLTFSANPALLEHMVAQGSIAIDGVSMTLAAVHASTFEVAVIPTTLAMTTLGKLKPGSQVNLETDILSRTVSAMVKKMIEPIVAQLETANVTAKGTDKGPITVALLKQAGLA